jgi:hypothetical protein
MAWHISSRAGSSEFRAPKGARPSSTIANPAHLEFTLISRNNKANMTFGLNKISTSGYMAAPSDALASATRFRARGARSP